MAPRIEWEMGSRDFISPLDMYESLMESGAEVRAGGKEVRFSLEGGVKEKGISRGDPAIVAGVEGIQAEMGWPRPALQPATNTCSYL